MRHRTWLSFLLLAVGAQAVVADPTPVPSPAVDFQERRQKVEEEYLKGLFGLAKEARGKQLDDVATQNLETILAKRSESAEAKALLETIRQKPSKPLEFAEADKLRAQMASQAQKLLGRTAEAYLKLALWCDKGKLGDEKTSCLNEGLALDPEHPKLREAAGFVLHPDYGWLDKESVQKLKTGLWPCNCEWHKWTEVQAERLKDFRERKLAALGQGFRVVITPYFNIAMDLTDKGYEKELLDGLTMLVRDEYRVFYGPGILDMKPFDVVIFQNRDDLKNYCVKQGIDKSFADAMGFYTTKEHCLYVWRLDARQGKPFLNGVGTPFHELTHGMIHDFTGRPVLPPWMDEGFASFFERARPGKDGRFEFGPMNLPRMSALRDALQAKKPFDLQELLGLPLGAFGGDRAVLNYNRSAIIMHYLHDIGKLRAFIQRVRAGNEEEALWAVTGKDAKALEPDLTTYASAKLK